tara:strand:- start:336 stop:545 length:210 start_codon:yes stop_codon:yes gene_type:complete
MKTKQTTEELIDSIEILIDTLKDFNSEMDKILLEDQKNGLDWSYEDCIDDVMANVSKLKHELWEESVNP